MNKIKWIGWFELILGFIAIPFLCYLIVTTDQPLYIYLIIGVLILVEMLAGWRILKGDEMGVTLSIIIQLLQLPYIYVKGFLYNIGIGTLWGFYFEDSIPSIDLTIVGIAFNVNYSLDAGASTKLGINIIALFFLWFLIAYRFRVPTSCLK